jgi:hypothetical protein
MLSREANSNNSQLGLMALATSKEVPWAPFSTISQRLLLKTVTTATPCSMSRAYTQCTTKLPPLKLKRSLITTSMRLLTLSVSTPRETSNSRDKACNSSKTNNIYSSSNSPGEMLTKWVLALLAAVLTVVFKLSSTLAPNNINNSSNSSNTT